MLMLMANGLTLLTIHKPFVLFGLTGYSFSLLFPIGLIFNSIIASIYDYALVSNMAWYLLLTVPFLPC